MKTLLKIGEFLNKITMVIISVLLMLMTVVYFAQVIARFVFNSGLAWSEELVRYSCIAMIFFASAALFKALDHVAITVLEEALPNTARKYLFVLLTLINLVYMAIVFVIGVQILEVAAFQKSPNMQIPMNILYLLFPISYAIMIYHTVVNLINRATYKRFEKSAAAGEVAQ